MFSSSKLLNLLCVFLPCMMSCLSASSSLPNSELKALQNVAMALNKTNWNFNSDPCSDGWSDPLERTSNSVTCNCSVGNNESCHIVSIILNYQNLGGVLPADLGGLPYLQILDLKYNYLNGTIPPEWGFTQLVNISLTGNQLTGGIPKEIANISTLKQLAVEYNRLSGVLPQELGNLRSIQNLFLTSNNFSGPLPESLGKLTTLIDLRIGDNPFTGPIPSFLRNLTSLQRLIIQGTNLSGPIPSGIGSLNNMSDLRITDLTYGTESLFPPLSNLTRLTKLILRNCNLTGQLPDYIGDLASSTLLLDLSFNKLSGGFPSTYINIAASKYIYLTSNMLNGSVPSYIYESGKSVDLSYNFFNETACQLRNINLFSISSVANGFNTIPCLQNYKCPKKKYYTMNINCGDQATKIGKTTYDADTDPGSPSRFYQSSTNWIYSSTGNFLDSNKAVDTYIQTNTTPLSPQASSLYLNARISPSSLTYYGFCLIDGNYTVHLHFAEIRFTGDKSYTSIGRRVFNVYIQKKLVLEDFNIEDEAGGVGIPIVKNFPAVVDSGSLEIRFYWAGKGTTGIPANGVYGPLISAISLTPNFPVPKEGKSLSIPAVIGIVVGALVAISVSLGILWRLYLTPKDTMEEDLKGIDLRTGSFTLRQIRAATNNFDPANKIGEGGFGAVYRGRLADGTTIAVKQLSSVSKQGSREFVNEVGMISALHHPNLVKLYGCCMEGNQMLLVYEYMENNSLYRALAGPVEYQLDLNWPTRQQICIGIARGLAFLHEESRVRIVHRDIKATNVLLDKNLNPKISDFGLAKLNESDNTHISTRIAGTYGYMAPEYAMRGQLTTKADVYSFGVVILEIVSGKSNTHFRPKEEDCFYLLDWALFLKQRGRLLELIDPRMGVEYNQDEVMTAVEVALLCTNVSPAIRPSMSAVVRMLEGSSAVQSVQPLMQNSLDAHPQKDLTIPDASWTATTFSNDDPYNPRPAASEIEDM